MYMNDASYTFNWLPQSQTTVLEGSGENHALCKFIQTFLSDGNVNSLCIYNGETSSYGGWSSNYGSCTSFNIEVRGEKTLQM